LATRIGFLRLIINSKQRNLRKETFVNSSSHISIYCTSLL